MNFANKQYRVKPDLYRIMPDIIPFKYGDMVRYRAKPERTGTIAGFIYHAKRHEPFYFLMIEGKMAKKRYYAEDIELMND
ncbi:MAG: hypothetical protein HY862_10895 [Chloroflexi bacterium]|nr:hypothetical protein [Chloroflexota bacterium]